MFLPQLACLRKRGEGGSRRSKRIFDPATRATPAAGADRTTWL